MWSNSGWVQKNGWYRNAATGGSFTPSSTQSLNFLTRVAAVTGVGNPTYGLSTNERNAIDALITGIITDLGGNTSLSTWPIADAVHVLKTASRAVAALNLVSSSYTLVEHSIGAAQFTVDGGYTGVSGGYLDTQFDPTATSGQNWSRDSASFFGYAITNFTTGNDYQSMGANGSGTFACRVYPHYNNDAAFCCVNSSSQTGIPGTNGAHFIGSVRTGASLQTTYIDGTTAITNNADTAPAGPTIVLLADSVSGNNPFLGNAGAYFIGGALTTTQVAALSARFATYNSSVP